MLYICAKFHEIISNSIKVLEWTQFLLGKLQRRIIGPKMQVEQLLLISACRLSCFIFLPSFVKLFRMVSKLQSGHDFYTENYKGESFHKKMLVE